jgi:hypothetical protein
LNESGLYQTTLLELSFIMTPYSSLLITAGDSEPGAKAASVAVRSMPRSFRALI